MIINLKEKILQKIEKLQLVLTTPESLKARRAGCYLHLYQMAYRLKLMGFRPETVIDIGANRGMFTRCIHYVFPDAFIHAFEPLRDCFEELATLKNLIPTLECYNLALGERSGETLINRSSYDYSSSLLEMSDLHMQAFPYTAGVIKEMVMVRKLDEVLQWKKLKQPVMMKIDVQGYEKFVLDGAPETLKYVDSIICEMSFYPLYKGQILFKDIYRQILDAGFVFRGPIAERCHPQTLEVLQIDGLFSREAT